MRHTKGETKMNRVNNGESLMEMTEMESLTQAKFHTEILRNAL